MGNIKNFNFNKLKLRLSNSDYWDFFLAVDDSPLTPSGPVSVGDCFVVHYDFNVPSIYPNNDTEATSIYSLVTWTGATNTGYTFSTIGLTGIDNGLITFIKNPLDPTNQNLVNALTGSSLVIPSGDNRLMMHLVTGTTENYVYPYERIIDTTDTIGDYVQFCGGFYQGFYKIDGSNYQLLPTRVNKGWVAEFWLNPQNICNPVFGTTLNDVYPENKGFFFYMGTRAENKFWNQFYGNNTGCASACTINTGSTECSGFTGSVTTWCTIPKEKDITIIGDYGFGIPLNPPRIDIRLITNPFLIYGRAYDSSAPRLTGATDSIIPSGITNTTDAHRYGCGATNIYGYMFNGGSCNLTSNDGLGTKTVCTYDGNGISVARTREVLTDLENPFLIYGRGSGAISGCSCSSCCGPNDGLGSETVCSYSGRTSKETEIDYNLDIIDNAIGFRITDDGRIGYRLLTVTGSCYTSSTGQRLYTSGVTIQEGYSIPNMVKPNVWSYIAIRYSTDYKNDCDLKLNKPRVGKLMFYVNAKLKYTINDFPEFIAKRLDEYKGKQVGVPFNFSLGGGSQGLIDTQTFDGQDQSDIGLPIQENFAGTFIGSISQFKFNICDLSYSQIQYNYLSDYLRYNSVDTNLLLTEDTYLLLQETGYGIIWI